MSSLRNTLLAAVAMTISTWALAQTTHEIPGDFETIQAAYDAAASNDIISIVEAGQYEGAQFEQVKNITVRNDSDGSVTITTTMVILREASEVAEFDVELEGLDFRPAPAFTANAIDIGAGARDIVIRNCTFFEADFPISSGANTTEEHTLLVEGCHFKDNNWGVVSFGNAQLTVRNSVFIDNTFNCINMQGPMNRLWAENCKFLIEDTTLGLNPPGGLVYFQNFGQGTEHDIINCVFDFAEPPAFSTLLQCNNSSDIRINHTTFGRTSFHSAYMLGAGHLIVRNSIFTGAVGIWAFADTPDARGDSDYCLFADTVGTPHAGSATSGDNDIFNGNPAFVGTGDDPYDITEDSDAINNADPASTVTEDLLGRERPTGSADIGAYEFPSEVVGPIFGDINGDGVVNVADVTLLANYVAGLVESIPGDGDINEDGEVDEEDVAALAEMIVN